MKGHCQMSFHDSRWEFVRIAYNAVHISAIVTSLLPLSALSALVIFMKTRRRWGVKRAGGILALTANHVQQNAHSVCCTCPAPLMRSTQLSIQRLCNVCSGPARDAWQVVAPQASSTLALIIDGGDVQH